LISGEADGFGDVIVDWYAGRLLVQWRTEAARSAELLEELRQRCEAVGAYEQLATRQKRSPVTATPRFVIQENGIRYLVGFGEGLSPGIFLDQRENRRRLLTMRLAGKFVLNLFAYTCAFSVAAAKAGAVTASVDLSRRYLAWGQDNFRANGLDVAGHEFVAGDVFEWLKRFGKRDRRWDVVLVDPPTFSTTKRGRVFQAARDYAALAALAMPAVAPGGWLFCSTNQRTLAPQQFEDALRAAAKQSGRVIEELEFETQPFDFRVAEGERPYLKTFWARLA
jgi:23S rRNA (cytosine1962-C5)-methyltransferase